MYNKRMFNNTELIEVLKNKNLKIKNERETFLFLDQVNYSKLKEYLYYFDKDNKNFNNKDFKEIIDLYNFDKLLREEINSCIEILEVYIKNNLIKILCLKSPFEYLNKDKFHNTFDFEKYIEEINQIIKKNKNSSPLIKTFFNKYPDEKRLPFWIIIEFFTFGKIGNIYNYLYKKAKIKITQLFDKQLMYKDFDSWLYNLIILRNLCSHNNRVWNRNFKPLANIPSNINNRTAFAEIYIIYILLKICGRENEIRRLRKECRKFFRKYPTLMTSFGIKELKDFNKLRF